MLAPQQHKIRHLNMEVKTPWATSAQDVHQRMKRLMNDAFWDNLSKRLDGMIAGDQLLRIEELQIDLGALEPESLDAIFQERLEDLLLKAIVEQLGTSEIQDFFSGIDGSRKGDLQVLEFYLQHGGTPWWYKGGPFLIGDKAAQLLQTATAAFSEMLRKHGQKARFLRRLLLAQNQRQRLALLQHLAGPVAAKMTAKMQEMEAQIAQWEGTVAERKEGSLLLWVATLQFLLSLDGHSVDVLGWESAVEAIMAQQFPEQHQQLRPGWGSADAPAHKGSKATQMRQGQHAPLIAWLSRDESTRTERLARWQALAALPAATLVDLLPQLRWSAGNFQRWWKSLRWTQIEPLMQRLAGAAYPRFVAVRAEWQAILNQLPVPDKARRQLEKQLLSRLIAQLLEGSGTAFFAQISDLERHKGPAQWAGLRRLTQLPLPSLREDDASSAAPETPPQYATGNQPQPTSESQSGISNYSATQYPGGIDISPDDATHPATGLFFESEAFLQVILAELLHNLPATMEERLQIVTQAIAAALSRGLLQNPWHVVVPQVAALVMEMERGKARKGKGKSAAQIEKTNALDRSNAEEMESSENDSMNQGVAPGAGIEGALPTPVAFEEDDSESAEKEGNKRADDKAGAQDNLPDDEALEQLPPSQHLDGKRSATSEDPESGTESRKVESIRIDLSEAEEGQSRVQGPWDALAQEIAPLAATYLATEMRDPIVLRQSIQAFAAGEADVEMVLEQIGRWSAEPDFARRLAALPSVEIAALLRALAPGYRDFLLELSTFLAQFQGEGLGTPLTGPRFWEPILRLILQVPAQELSRHRFLEALLGGQQQIWALALRAEKLPRIGQILRSYLEAATPPSPSDVLRELQALIAQMPAFAAQKLETLQAVDGSVWTAQERLQQAIDSLAAQAQMSSARLRQFLWEKALQADSDLHAQLAGILAPIQAWVAKPALTLSEDSPSVAALAQMLASAQRRPYEWPGLAFMIGVWGLEPAFFQVAAQLSDVHKSQLLSYFAPGYPRFARDLVQDVAVVWGYLERNGPPKAAEYTLLWEALFRALFRQPPGSVLQTNLVQALLRKVAVPQQQLAPALQAMAPRLRLGRIMVALLPTLAATAADEEEAADAAGKPQPISAPTAIPADALTSYLQHGQLPVGTDELTLRTRLLTMARQFPQATVTFMRGLGSADKVVQALHLLLPTEALCQLIADLGLFEPELLVTLCLEADVLSQSPARLPQLGSQWRKAMLKLILAQGALSSVADLAAKALFAVAKPLQLSVGELLARILHSTAAADGRLPAIVHLAEGLAQKLHIPLEFAEREPLESRIPRLPNEDRPDENPIPPQSIDVETGRPSAPDDLRKGSPQVDAAFGTSQQLQADARQLALALQGKGRFPGAQAMEAVLSERMDLLAAVAQLMKGRSALRSQAIVVLSPGSLYLLAQQQYGATVGYLPDLVLVMARHAQEMGAPSKPSEMVRSLLDLGLLRRVGPERLAQQWIATLALKTPEAWQQLQDLVLVLAPLFRHPLSRWHFINGLRKLRPTSQPPKPAAATQKETSPGQKLPWRDDATESQVEYAVSNAGIVLLWPFFDRYFAALGLLKNGKFRGMAARERAVFLLQYLCKGETRPAEEALVLPKVLCGLDPAELLRIGSIRPKPAEIEVTQSLLHAAVGHWRTLGDTSVPTFQETFLDRPGQLKIGEKRFDLAVDGRSYDLLMRTLPWGLNPVNLSWMRKIMEVKWA